MIFNGKLYTFFNHLGRDLNPGLLGHQNAWPMLYHRAILLRSKRVVWACEHPIPCDSIIPIFLCQSFLHNYFFLTSFFLSWTFPPPLRLMLGFSDPNLFTNSSSFAKWWVSAFFVVRGGLRLVDATGPGRTGGTSGFSLPSFRMYSMSSKDPSSWK